MNVIERVKHELKYNTSPAIPYIKIGKGDVDTLVRLAQDNQARLDFQTVSMLVKQTHEIERLRKALEFYADGSRYVTQYDSDFNGRTNAYTPIKDDNGKIAKEALGIGEESNAL